MIELDRYIDLYVETLSMLGLTAGEVRAGAGGACVLHGVRPHTGDLDLEVESPTFYRLVEELGLEVQRFDNGWVLANVMEDVDIHPVDHALEGVMVHGVYTTSLEQTLGFKLGLNRPKDQDDIVKLREMIATLGK